MPCGVTREEPFEELDSMLPYERDAFVPGRERALRHPSCEKAMPAIQSA